ncbi:DsbA family protein [Nostoc sp. XA010]|uniref:DsbA family protein n=1 Tax=Nostoc sp. XA010 TaxID=2780407 RepID=UPI001E29CED2|nr:DsbA family protein [Nostoc sp. XA010]MCC5660185.1 DsbA family protein [Nostoc sp. XA010]
MLRLNIQPPEVSVSFDRDRSSLFFPPSTQDHIKGMLNATVVVVMYGDYQCSQSADVYRLIKVIERQLSVFLGENYLCFTFRHFPQIEIHPHAQRAAEAAKAAAVQGLFWQMHEMLFANQKKLKNGYLIEYANNLKLDISQFLQDIFKKVYVNAVNEDIQSGLHSGVTFAPALFINGIRYSERWNIEQLMAAIVTASNQR